MDLEKQIESHIEKLCKLMTVQEISPASVYGEC